MPVDNLSFTRLWHAVRPFIPRASMYSKEPPKLLRLVDSDVAPTPRLSPRGNTGGNSDKRFKPFTPPAVTLPIRGRIVGSPAGLGMPGPQSTLGTTVRHADISEFSANQPLRAALERSGQAGRSALRLSEEPAAMTASPAALAHTPSDSAKVARENHISARLSYDDARWVLAVRINQALEGGQAARLAPEKRRAVTREAEKMGLTAFDANLLIAIVQDGVRSGEGGISPKTQGRLALVREAQTPTPFEWPLVLAAVMMGLILAWAMIDWVVARG